MLKPSVSIFGIWIVEVVLNPFINPISFNGGGSEVGIGGGIVVVAQMLLFKKFNGLLLEELEWLKKLPKLTG